MPNAVDNEFDPPVKKLKNSKKSVIDNTVKKSELNLSHKSHENSVAKPVVAVAPGGSGSGNLNVHIVIEHHNNGVKASSNAAI